MELRVLAVAGIRLVKEENKEGEIERRFGQSWWLRERERELGLCVINSVFFFFVFKFFSSLNVICY